MKNRNSYTQKQRLLGGLNRLRRDEDFEEVIARFLNDRKGHIVAEGVTYSADGESAWQVVHSTDHVNRFDVICDGERVAISNPRSLPTKWIRKRASKAKLANTNYYAINRTSSFSFTF